MFRSVIRHLPANEKQRCVSYGHIIIGFWWKHFGDTYYTDQPSESIVMAPRKTSVAEIYTHIFEDLDSVWIAGYLLRKLMEGVLPCGLQSLEGSFAID